MSGVKILMDEWRGVFLPAEFSMLDSDWTITDEQREILGKGPTGDHYWDCWNEVLLNARFVDSNGFEWQLFQEGDLFAICPELMTNEEKRNFELDHLIEEEV